MRLAFMGTPEFAVRALAELIASGHEIACVYSQPPRPKGRGQTLQPSPVHAFAESMGLTVRTPVSMKSPEAMAEFAALDLDAAVVVAYGQILKKPVLEAPKLGCFNLHASLLPRWRGAAPIQRAIMAGDTQTGVQVMRMSEGLDEGPVILSAVTPIHPNDTAQSLHDRLAGLGAALLAPALAALERGGAQEKPQTGTPTYAAKISPAEARIDWSRPASEVDCHIRGLSPFPGAWFTVESPQGKSVRVKALMSEAVTDFSGGKPGTVCDDALLIACGDGAVRLTRVQREGKSVQTAEQFLHGFALTPGTVLSGPEA